MEANWVRINVAIRSALEEITLADMSRPITPSLVRLRRLGVAQA
jgi:hypothetical protein